MEKNFYQDNFEQLLKENADNFRMYPSKRVWHSIYNDLHPSRRWPSLAIWVLLISSIVYIGISNMKQELPGQKQVASASGRPTIIASVAAGSNITYPAGTFQHSNINAVATTPVSTQTADQDNMSNTGSIKPVRFNSNAPAVDQQVAVLTSFTKKTAATGNTLATNKPGNDKKANTARINIIGGTEESEVAAVSMVTMDDIKDLISNKKEASLADLINKKDDAADKKENAETSNKSSAADKNNTTEKQWIEDFAFHNKPFSSKWKTRVSYRLYFTPSIGYRIMSKNSSYDPVSSSIVTTTGNVQDYKKALSHSAAVNMEIGGSILYNIARNWNLKVGIQLNYTNYNINAYELKHPTMTTLTLNDLNNGLPRLDPRPTTLANIEGVYSKNLNNNTYQVSIPLGADIKIAGKNDLKWYAGATIQPTYITGGNAYLVSSDLKNYVTDKSLMRNWNLNAGFETFVSYKTKSGIIINAGPQFRYQLLSTYTSQYTYNERLYNFGLKIGITTKF